ncbi:MAG: hypothetical protein QXZ22_08230 [Sulfolobales archaeon]
MNKMTLREFKVKQIIKIKELKEELVKKYPDKEKRVEEITALLLSKLSHLRIYSLYDYLETIYLASREFPEFISLMPTVQEVNKLLEEAGE